MSKNRFLFLTGHLVHEPLCALAEQLPDDEFMWEVRDMGVQVASLMTNNVIKRRLTDLDDVSHIMLPGLMRGETEELRQHFGVTVVRGPDDFRDIPQWLGAPPPVIDLQEYDCLIFAEITDAPLLAPQDILAAARVFAAQGADVIDVGCLPDVPFDHLERVIALLCGDGHTVSIDSADYDDLKRGVAAGASYILSLHEGTLAQAHEDGLIPQATPILIPQAGEDMDSLERAIGWCHERNIECLADPILTPLPQGLMNSLVRYHQLRRRHESVPIFMGVGNVTELHDADSAGVVSLLMGVAAELNVAGVLMVAVSPHCRRAIAEADRARRIHHYARRHQCLSVRIDDGLMALHDKKPAWQEPHAIEAMAKKITDPNYRIMLSTEGIHVFNRDIYIVAQSVDDAFDQLQMKSDPSHAYYMGVQLARAEIAWRLGKNYQQDQDLHWGVAVSS